MKTVNEVLAGMIIITNEEYETLLDKATSMQQVAVNHAYESELRILRGQLHTRTLGCDALKEALYDSNKQLKITKERLAVADTTCATFNATITQLNRRVEELSRDNDALKMLKAATVQESCKAQETRATFENISRDLNDAMQHARRTINMLEQINAVAYKRSKS